jgi:hypothetical protein
MGEEEREDEGGHRRGEGRPPPRSPHTVAPVTLGERGDRAKRREKGKRKFLK